MESSTKRRRWYAVLATTALVLSAFAGVGAADDHNGNSRDSNEHCPDHRDNPKVEAEEDEDGRAEADEVIDVDNQEVQVVIDGDMVNFYDEDGNPISVEYCIKASKDNSGPQEGSEGEVTWQNDGGDAPDISYVVVYGVSDDGSEPVACPDGEDGAVGDISLDHADGAEDPATNPVGEEHTVTATVTDAEGEPCEDVEVLFEVDGDGSPNPGGGDGTTDESGEADFSFVNNDEGTNAVTGCTDDDGSLPESCDDADHSDTATKHWEDDGTEPAACPDGEDGAVGDISLAHEDGSTEPATNPVGEEHTVTATVTDAEGEPCEDVEVLFEVDGDGSPNPGGADVTTDESGAADFSFSNEEEGENTITACTNDDGSLPDSCDTADHSDSVTKNWEDGGVTEATCRASVVDLGDGQLVIAEANPDGTPCTSEDGSIVNEAQLRLLQAETHDDQDGGPSASSEAVGLGGSPDDPGRISVLGTETDCENQGAHVLLIEQDGEEVLRLSGEDDPLPNLAMEESGIFLTRTSEEDGTAEAVALTFEGDDFLVLSQSETRC